MTRRQMLGAAAAAIAGAQQNTEPPNILFLMPDQWRGMDLGSAGNRQVRTPNLDKLAADGMQFDNAVANTPVCTPARSTVLTGRYPHATGTAVNDVRLPIHEVTLPEMLRQRGYYTGFIGKWHLDGGLRMPGYVPPGERRQGFDYWAANECSHAYFKQWYFRDDPKRIDIAGYEVFEWTKLGSEFLDNAKNKKQPFCLYMQYGPPHDPYLAPPGYETMYDPAKIEMRKNWKPGAQRNGTSKEIAGYYAAIACLDEQIGQLLGKLDSLGMTGNTIVFVTSDHGDMLGSQELSSSAPVGRKRPVYPVSSAGPTASGRRQCSKAPFSHVDVVPTLLGLCGMETPARMHGHDYSSHVRDGSGETPEFSHLMIYTKTEADEHGPWRGLRSSKWKYARHEDRPWVLYDLENDPYEMNNLAADRSRAKLMAGFDSNIAAQMAATGDRWDELFDRPYR
ncbi:MAG: sulfatase [Bryobacteraceae bacterium]